MTQPCAWVGNNQLYQEYHDKEWGKAEFNSQKLFEQLCLEGQQAGLSWITVLTKRENYRQAFYQFNPEKIAQMNDIDIEQLMQNSGLIRHRAKLEAIVKNAKAYLAMQQNGEDFSQFIWQFVNGKPQCHDVPDLSTIPSKTDVSRAMSNALKQKGFTFVGEITCYAFMQAMGLVDDHHNDCPCKTPI